ncbi:MAG: hypothetical protein WDN08_01735 [Rhizomicrobium sp.]
MNPECKCDPCTCSPTCNCAATAKGCDCGPECRCGDVRDAPEQAPAALSCGCAT